MIDSDSANLEAFMALKVVLNRHDACLSEVSAQAGMRKDSPVQPYVPSSSLGCSVLKCHRVSRGTWWARLLSCGRTGQEDVHWRIGALVLSGVRGAPFAADASYRH